MEKPKVLYLSYDGLTDPLGGSQILPYLLGLSDEFDITVVSFEKQKSYKANIDCVRGLLQQKLEWIPKKYTKKPPILSTLYDMVVLWVACKKLISESGHKIVHCRSYIASLVGVRLKQKYSLKFVFDMRGFWADERIDGALWKPRNPVHYLLYQFFKRREIQFISQADHIVSLTERSKEIIFSLFEKKKLSRPPITVIPCCVDMDLFDPSNTAEKKFLRKRLHLKGDEFILIYLGSIGTWYMLSEMLDFFKVLLSRYSNAVFLFVTGELEQYIQEAAIKKGIDASKIIVKKASRSEVPDYISLADLSIFFIRPTFSKQGSSPTKLAETLALGVPIVANSGIGDVDQLFKENNIGILIKSFQEGEYLRAMAEIPQLDKESIRRVAFDHFSLNMAISLYSKIYSSLT